MSAEASKTKSSAESTVQIDANSVGWYFAKKYYTILNEDPGVMHCFYSKVSSCIHGTEGERIAPAVGNSEIHKLFISSGFDRCKVRLSNIESIDLVDGLILVQSIGEMANEGQSYKRFVQTFLLERSENRYYCKNDILRFLKDYNEKGSTTSVEAWKENESESSTASAPKVYDMPTPSNAIEAAASTLPKQTAQSQAPPNEAPLYKMPEPTQSPLDSGASTSQEKATPAPTPATDAKTAVSQKEEAPKAEQSAPAPPKAPSSWANLAAANSNKWGSAASKVEGTAVPAASPAHQSSSSNSNQGAANRGGPSSERGKPRKKELYPIYVKNIPVKADTNSLTKAFAKFGTVNSIDILQAGNAVIDFASLDAQKSALTSRTMNLDLGGSFQPVVVTIEERRGPGRDFKGTRGNNSQRGSNDYERSGSSRGRAGGRPRSNNKQ
ncbi:putative G3BP-like protein [Smittium culicis]|uniref:Putative G3BP-like protein n=1 Tax=Smittium culicis TaxID=133412 RepID=A0A1R1XXX8_9FUNG|nr:putative G3BP-like protein [Smittium culicis]